MDTGSLSGAGTHFWERTNFVVTGDSGHHENYSTIETHKCKHCRAEFKFDYHKNSPEEIMKRNNIPMQCSKREK